MGHPNIAPDAVRWARGSRTEGANASWRNGENCLLVPRVITSRMPTLTHRSMSITHFTENGIGGYAKPKRHLQRLWQMEREHIPLSAAIGRGEVAWGGQPR